MCEKRPRPSLTVTPDDLCREGAAGLCGSAPVLMSAPATWEGQAGVPGWLRMGCLSGHKLGRTMPVIPSES